MHVCSPVTLARIALNSLRVERTLSLNDTLGSFGVAADPAARKLFVATGAQLVRVGLDWLEREDALLINGASSLSINKHSGILYVGTHRGQASGVVFFCSEC